MSQELPSPPAPPGQWSAGPSQLALPGQPATQTVSPKRKRGLIIGGIVAGLIALAGLGQAMTRHTPNSCVDAAKLGSQMTAVKPLVSDVNATSDLARASTDLRAIGRDLDGIAVTVAADPSISKYVHSAAADERRAATALDANDMTAAATAIAAFNSDMKAAQIAAQASSVGAC